MDLLVGFLSSEKYQIKMHLKTWSSRDVINVRPTLGNNSKWSKLCRSYYKTVDKRNDYNDEFSCFNYKMHTMISIITTMSLGSPEQLAAERKIKNTRKLLNKQKY